MTGTALPARGKVSRYRAVKTHIVLRDKSAPRAAAELDQEIEAFIKRPNSKESEFNRLALELFAYQYCCNPAYRKFCDQRTRTPAHVYSWRDVPALSAESFAEVRLACFPPEQTVLKFVSSGTTRAGTQSVHELENAILYDASLLAHFRRCVLPDREKIRIVLLSPSFDKTPHSSLAYMLSTIYAAHGSGGGFFIRDGSLDFEGALSSLRMTAEPILIFGTAFAFVHFLDRCRADSITFSLPSRSRIVETGGFKGKSRSIERAEFYDALSQTFGVLPDLCIAEYGMCELGSQWYDASLRDKFCGRNPREQLKIGPHWTRILVVDPVTAQEVPKGSIGLLQCFDLSNRGSVAAVLTGDLVRAREDGFIYVGRSQAAPPKGCSIAVDAMLRSHA